MKSEVLRINRNSFVRNVLIMATGTAAAQVITMSLSPFITRLYGPEAFGLLGAFTAIIAIVSPIAALTYPTAIVLPKNEKDANGLIRLSLSITIIIAIIMALILVIFNDPVIELLKLEEIATFLYLIPLVVLFSGSLEVVEQWLIRTKQFGITAKVTFSQSLILNGSKVGMGLAFPFAATLIILTVLGQVLKTTMMLLWIRRSSDMKSIKEINTGEKVPIRELAIKYKNFPVYRAPQVFLNGASQSLPILMLTSLFGPASAGYYTIGRTVLNIPTELIGKSVGDVFYPRISEAANNGENLTYLIRKATIILGVVGLLPFGIVVAFGPWLFSLVFGSEWTMAGEYARWIALWSYFIFINQPSIKALPVLSAQAFHLRFTTFTLLTRMAALAVGYYVFNSDLIAIALTGVSGALLNLTLILITIWKSKSFNK